MKWFPLVTVLALLVTACCPAHTTNRGNGAKSPAVGDPEAQRTEIFLIVELDAEFYIQIDAESVDFQVDAAADVTRVEMVDDFEGMAFIGSLSAPAARRVHAALGSLGPIQVMDGGFPAEDVFFGPPVLVGRVVPHFGEIDELEEQGIFLDDEDQGALRKQFFLGTAPVIMIPVQGELYDSMTMWARTRTDRRPKVAVFDAGPLGSRDDEAAEVAAAMPAWTEAIARVDQAYLQDEHGEVPFLEDELWSAVYLNDEDEPVGDAWTYYYVHYGETFCGEGPDEARLAGLWSPKSSLDKPMVLATEEADMTVIEPYIIGDLDGDGAVEMIGLTSDLTGEIQLLRIKDGVLETLKTAGPIYRDCPC